MANVELGRKLGALGRNFASVAGGVFGGWIDPDDTLRAELTELKSQANADVAGSGIPVRKEGTHFVVVAGPQDKYTVLKQ